MLVISVVEFLSSHHAQLKVDSSCHASLRSSQSCVVLSRLSPQSATWKALDMTVEHQKEGIRSNPPMVSGKDWDSLQSLWKGSPTRRLKVCLKHSVLIAMSQGTPPRLHPPPLSGPDSVDFEAVSASVGSILFCCFLFFPFCGVGGCFAQTSCVEPTSNVPDPPPR